MGSNKTFYIVLVSIIVLLVGAVAFFFVRAMPSGQSNNASEISNGEGVTATESSGQNDEGNGEMAAEVITITETDDFVFTISAEKTTMSQSEIIRLYAELKNNSGEDRMIRNDFRFKPLPIFELESTPGGVSIAPCDTSAFEAGSVMRRLPSIRNTLEPGTHELQFIAVFSLLDSETGEWVRLNILSNPITLTSTDDFILTVSIEETTLQRGEDFRVIAELKNNTGEDRVISYEFLFFPLIPEWEPFGDLSPGSIYTGPITFEANSVLRNTEMLEFRADEKGWRIGADLDYGTHEIRISVSFWFQGDIQSTNFRSDPIVLTVCSSCAFAGNGICGIGDGGELYARWSVCV